MVGGREPTSGDLWFVVEDRIHTGASKFRTPHEVVGSMLRRRSPFGRTPSVR